MVDCSSGLARWLRSVVNIERKDSVVTTEPDTTDTSSSQESLDSGFVELSETSSSFSLKSILRQNVNNTTGGDPKKKVSICAPTSPRSVSHKRMTNKGVKNTISSQLVLNDKAGNLAEPPALMDVSAQIKKMVEDCRSSLNDLYPQLTSSIEVLFEADISVRLASLSSNKIAELLHSLRVLLFSPPALHRDIVINKVMALLVAVTRSLQLEDLHQECVKMCEVCQSGHYYQHTDFYWTHGQTLLISVWCRIILL